MTHPVNPYVAGRPLREESKFFGRADMVKWVSQELLNPTTNAVALFGQRRIGKTTLLLQLKRILAGDDFLPIYFDLQDQATRPLGEVLLDLVDVVSGRANVEVPDLGSIDEEGHFFRYDFLPQLYQALKEGCRPIFLLDEFDVLHQTAEGKLPQNVATRTLFPFLRGLMNEEPRLAFVFAVGRRAEDLSIDFTSFFKGALVRELWVLDEESAKSLILQAQANSTLHFTDQAVERILSLAGRHPYMTQLLCQRVWERAYARNPTSPPEIDPSDVEASVLDALEVGKSALLWLWQGLNPAERIYAAALAEAADEGAEIISEDQVIQVLTAHAPRLRRREIELAPRDLVKRRVLKESREREYRFAVEIFRRWVHQHQPLRDLKDELDQYSLARSIFDIGQTFFDQEEWEEAVRYFRNVLQEDAHHFRAKLHLGEALLELGQTDEAVVELEQAYELDRNEARFPLARALMAQAKALKEAGDEDSVLATCGQVLQISPNEKAAQEMRNTIWTQRGDAAMEQGDLKAALAAYQQTGVEGWEDAVVLVRHALESESSLFRTRFRLGEILLELGQTEKAMTELDTALAVYQQVAFDYEKAVDFFQLLLEREPQNTFARLHLGGLLRTKGWVDRAVDQLEKAYSLGSTMARPYLVYTLLEQAQAAREVKDWSAALDAYVRLLEVDSSRLDVLGAMKGVIVELHRESVEVSLRSPGGQDQAYIVPRVDKKQLGEILLNAENQVRLLGVVALDIDWSALAEKWAARLKDATDFEVTVLCESDNLLFAKSLTLDTDRIENRRSFRELKFIRDRALSLPIFLHEAGVPEDRVGGIDVEIMHLPMPIAIAQIDDKTFASLWLHEIEDHFEEIADNHPWYPLIEKYISTYFDPKRGRKYASNPKDELLELYDHDRIPRGIYPRESFYDTDYSQLVVWALIFDRQGRLLIHRRSDNAKDNQSMWDKSVGGHIEFTDYHTSRAAYREVIEELFTEEPEDIMLDLKKWKISDEEFIYLGDWRPDRRKRCPFDEIRSFNREWAFFRLPEVEGLERLYSPRTLPDSEKGKIRRLRVIPDIFLFVAGPQLTKGFLNRLKNSTFKLIELPELKSVMDRAIRGDEVPGFDENRFDENKIKAVPEFTPDLEEIMTGKLRDILDEFSQYIKRYIKA